MRDRTKAARSLGKAKGHSLHELAAITLPGTEIKNENRNSRVQLRRDVHGIKSVFELLLELSGKKIKVLNTLDLEKSGVNCNL